MPTTKACLSCDAYVEARTRYCDKCQSILVGVDEFVIPDMAPPKAGRRLLDARIGTVLGGSLVIESFLGHGGDGPVYRGRDRQTGAIVGVKRERAGAPAPIDGPHVVATLPSVRSADDKPFVVMEICTGGNLREALDASRAAGQGLGHARIVEILRQIVRGLASYHTRGLVHGDLKPENVLLSQPQVGKVVLKLADALGAEGGPGGAHRGTPPYAAPEVCAGAAPSAQADFWALGVIAFELVTGRLPFEATGADGLARQVVSESVPVPPLGRDVRRGLAALVRTLLDRTPSGRPEGVVPILEALDRIEAEALPWERPAALAIAGLGLAMLLLGLVLGGDAPKPMPVEPPPPVAVVPTPAVGSTSGAAVPAVAPKPPVEPELSDLEVVRQRLRAVGTSDWPDGAAPAGTAAELVLDLKTAPANDLTVELEIDAVGEPGRFVKLSSQFEKTGRTLVVPVPAQAVGKRTLKIALRSTQHLPKVLTNTFTWFEPTPSVAIDAADGDIRCSAAGFARVALVAGNETVLQFEVSTPPTKPELLRPLPKEWEAPWQASFYLAGEPAPVAFDPPVAVSVEGRPFKPELETQIAGSFLAGQQLPEFRVRCIDGCSFTLRKLGGSASWEQRLVVSYEGPVAVVEPLALKEAGRFEVSCKPPSSDLRPPVIWGGIEVKEPVFRGVEAKPKVEARCVLSGLAVKVQFAVDGASWPNGTSVELSNSPWSCVQDRSKPGRWIFTRPAVSGDESVVQNSDIVFHLVLGSEREKVVASHQDALGAAPQLAESLLLGEVIQVEKHEVSLQDAANANLLTFEVGDPARAVVCEPFQVAKAPVGPSGIERMKKWLERAKGLVPSDSLHRELMTNITPKPSDLPHTSALKYVTWLNHFGDLRLQPPELRFRDGGYHLLAPMQALALHRLKAAGGGGVEWASDPEVGEPLFGAQVCVAADNSRIRDMLGGGPVAFQFMCSREAASDESAWDSEAWLVWGLAKDREQPLFYRRKNWQERLKNSPGGRTANGAPYFHVTIPAAMRSRALPR